MALFLDWPGVAEEDYLMSFWGNHIKMTVSGIALNALQAMFLFYLQIAIHVVRDPRKCVILSSRRYLETVSLVDAALLKAVNNRSSLIPKK